MESSVREGIKLSRVLRSALAILVLHVLLAQAAMLAYSRFAPGVPDRGMVSLPELPRTMLSAVNYLGGNSLWIVFVLACVAYAAPALLCGALYRDRWSGVGVAAGLCIILFSAILRTMRAAEAFAELQSFLGISTSPLRYFVNHLAVVLASVAAGLASGVVIRRVSAGSSNPALQPTGEAPAAERPTR